MRDAAGAIHTLLRAPRTLLFGDGTMRLLGEVVREHGSTALVCTDPALAATRTVREALERMAAAGIDVRLFAETPSDVPLAAVDACLQTAGATPVEVVVGLGGGSSIDMAKLAALLLTHGRPLERYYGEGTVPGPCLPVVAVPTTAGTGSEVSPVAVLSDPQRRMKVGIASAHLVPVAAVCDPEATLSCPPSVTAHAGMDAVVHAVEAYTAIRRPDAWDVYPGPLFRGKNAFSDLHAITAITHLHRSLERAVQHGDDRRARADMLFGSLSAGLAFAHAGTAGAHALQYPIGAATGTPHGLGVAVLAPYVFEFTRPEADHELGAIGRAIGVVGPDDGDDRAAGAAIDALERLGRSVGIPGSLAELGIAREAVDGLAADAATIDRLLCNSPRPLDRPALAAILRAAVDGDRDALRRVAA